MISVTQAPTPLTVKNYLSRKSATTVNQYPVNANGKKVLFMDQVRDFAVRDPKLIKPGDKVVFLHVPQLDLENPDHMSSTLSPFYSVVTVVEIAEKSFNELHPKVTTNSEALEEKNLVILFDTNYGVQYRHITDAGVLPYNNFPGAYNPTNFTVLVSDLEAAGVELEFKTSPEYSSKLDQINAAYLKSDNYKYNCELDEWYASQY